MMYLKNAINSSKDILSELVEKGDRVIDATVGNGSDTLLIADLIGASGVLYGFDVQSEAIKATEKKLMEHNNLDRVILINESHDRISEYVKNGIDAAVFNLGYLPGGSHEIMTKPETTIPAVKACLSLLRKGGIILITVYHGGDTGFKERDELIKYVKTIDQKRFTVQRRDYLNWINNPPFLILIEKL